MEKTPYGVALSLLIQVQDFKKTIFETELEYELHIDLLQE